MKAANENVLRALAKATTEARAGNVAAVAIITISPDGVPEVTFGGESELVPSVNFGVDLLKARLVQQVMRTEEKPVTSIVRAAEAKLDS